jgi:hypothetical protein
VAVWLANTRFIARNRVSVRKFYNKIGDIYSASSPESNNREASEVGKPTKIKAERKR